MPKIFRIYPLCGFFGNLFFFFYNPWILIKKKLKRPKKPRTINKILLCVQGALGDVVLIKPVVDGIKKKWPHIYLGILCTKEALPAATWLGIDQIHVGNSLKIAGENRVNVLLRILLSSHTPLVQELKKQNYDLSIELHPFFPNSILFCDLAGIPEKLGFDASGMDLFLTKISPFPTAHEYLLTIYSHLGFPIHINFEKVTPENYIILHLGTSDPLKKWEIHEWKKLATRLYESGFILYFTGYGSKELNETNQAFEGLGFNLCNKLSFTEFATCIQKSSLLISVDSVSIHLAYLYAVPMIGIYLHNHYLDLWIPPATNSCFFVSNQCRRQKTLFNASYQDLISSEEIFNAAISLLN